MPRPRSDSREKIIKSAQTLFRRHGYHVTGLARIVEHSGSPRGSIYFLFPGGKEEIAAEAIRAWCAEIDDLLRSTAAANTTAVGWLGALAGHFAGELRESGYTEGLPLTTLVLDSVPDSEVITAVCRDTYRTWGATTAEILRSYGVHPDRLELLTYLTQAGLEGSFVLSRVHGTTEPLERLVPLITSLIDN